MKKSYVKVHYKELPVSKGIIPLYHTSLEICLNGKKKFVGFYNKDHKSTARSVISLIKYVPAKICSENPKDEGIVLTRDPKKVGKLLRVFGEFRWTSYHALFHNCFHWRNAVLKKAGIEAPNDRWWKRAS